MGRWLLIGFLLLGSVLGRGQTTRQALLPEGEPHIFTVLVEFRNIRFTLEEPQARFSALLNNDVSAYFEENSGGLFRPVFDVYGPVLLEKPMASYGQDLMENGERLGDIAPERALYEACRLLDREVDFASYDANGDGILDLVLFFYAGYDQAGGASADAIWSHHADVLTCKDQEVLDARWDGKGLGYYFCTSELRGTDGAQAVGIGPVIHEMGHALGLPDLYDTDGAQNGLTGGMYQFSVMADGLYNKQGDAPPALVAVEKLLLGWMAPEQLIPLKEGWMHLPVGETAVSATTTEGECFYYEALPAGLLVYHVDSSEREVGGHPASWYWADWRASNRVNAYGKHPCCYVVPPQEPHNYNAASPNPATLLFPGVGSVHGFLPEDWEGEAGTLALSCIDPEESGIRFRVLESGAHVLCGLVLDSQGVPVPGAQIQLFADTECAGEDRSDMFGYYQLETSVETAGQWLVRVSKPGYRTMERETAFSHAKLLCEYLPLVKNDASASTLFYTYDPSGSSGFFAQEGREPLIAAVRFTAEDLAPFVGRRLAEVVCFPYVTNPETIGNLYVTLDVAGERRLNQDAGTPELGEYAPVTIPLEADFRIPEGLALYVGYGFQECGDNQPLTVVYPGERENSFYTPFSLEKSDWKPLYQKKAGFYMDLMLQVRLEEVPAETPADMGYACIALPEGPLKAGEWLDLQVLMPADARFKTVTWRFDGKILAGTRLELPSGEHTLEARVQYEDTREEILRAPLTVN